MMNGIFLGMNSPQWVTEETITVDPDLHTAKSLQRNAELFFSCGGDTWVVGLLDTVVWPVVLMVWFCRSPRLCSC